MGKSVKSLGKKLKMQLPSKGTYDSDVTIIIAQ